MFYHNNCVNNTYTTQIERQYNQNNNFNSNEKNKENYKNIKDNKTFYVPYHKHKIIKNNTSNKNMLKYFHSNSRNDLKINVKFDSNKNNLKPAPTINNLQNKNISEKCYIKPKIINSIKINKNVTPDLYTNEIKIIQNQNQNNNLGILNKEDIKKD